MWTGLVSSRCEAAGLEREPSRMEGKVRECDHQGRRRTSGKNWMLEQEEEIRPRFGAQDVLENEGNNRDTGTV